MAKMGNFLCVFNHNLKKEKQEDYISKSEPVKTDLSFLKDNTSQVGLLIA